MWLLRTNTLMLWVSESPCWRERLKCNRKPTDCESQYWIQHGPIYMPMGQTIGHWPLVQKGLKGSASEGHKWDLLPACLHYWWISVPNYGSSGVNFLVILSIPDFVTQLKTGTNGLIDLLFIPCKQGFPRSWKKKVQINAHGSKIPWEYERFRSRVWVITFSWECQLGPIRRPCLTGQTLPNLLQTFYIIGHQHRHC